MKAIRGRFLRRTLGATLSRRCNPNDTLMAASFSSSSSKMNETGGIADPKHDLEALNRFTSGRWLWNERQQLACRYVKFDLSTLLQLAASAIGSRSCTQVLKISEGQYNKVFQLTMDDGRKIIAKLPDPNAGRPHFTTASEVATMDFLRNVLSLPVLRVYAWGFRASENPLGAEYILIEKQAGTNQYNLPDNLDSNSPLYLNSTGNKVRSKNFGIRPTNYHSFFNFGRGKLDIKHGSTATEYIIAIVITEIATAKAGLRLSKKLSALENYLKVAPYILPENKATHALNIFVDPEDPGCIVGVIDWQSVIPEDLGKVPLPPNFNSMDPDEQQNAKALHRAQTLHNLYLVRCLQVNKTVFQAIQGQNTLRHQVSVVPGLILMDYEPLLNSLLRDVEKEWAHIVGVEGDGRSPGTPFPLQSSGEEIQQQEQDGELWAQGVELMNEFIGGTGCFKHWDGRVNDVDYEKSRRELDEGVKRFLDREARNDEEHREWLKALPFVD
ncbi:hypothetical protein BJX76DRAFT_348840 [Aspergillus varians]